MAEYEVDDGTGTVHLYQDVTPKADGGVLKRMIKPGDPEIGKAPLGVNAHAQQGHSHPANR